MSHLSLNIDAKSIPELREKVLKALTLVETSGIGNHFSIGINANTTFSYEQDYASKLAAETLAPKVEAETVEAPKEKKAKKEKASLEVSAEVTASVNFEAKTESKVTKEAIQEACQKLSEQKGIDAAKALLGSFVSQAGVACRRISDIQESDYETFIAKCAA